jgi:hypothetical protein
MAEYTSCLQCGNPTRLTQPGRKPAAYCDKCTLAMAEDLFKNRPDQIIILRDRFTEQHADELD